MEKLKRKTRNVQGDKQGITGRYIARLKEKLLLKGFLPKKHKPENNEHSENKLTKNKSLEVKNCESRNQQATICKRRNILECVPKLSLVPIFALKIMKTYVKTLKRKHNTFKARPK